MHPLKINTTTYKLASLDRVLAVQAIASKITGKHKPVRPKGGTGRLYPDNGDKLTTAEYVSIYYTLNSNRRNFKSGVAPYGDANLAGFYEGLSDQLRAPQGVDSMEIEQHDADCAYVDEFECDNLTIDLDNGLSAINE